jgi:hypothetical protein
VKAVGWRLRLTVYITKFAPQVGQEDTTHDQGEDDHKACINMRVCGP